MGITVLPEPDDVGFWCCLRINGRTGAPHSLYLFGSRREAVEWARGKLDEERRLVKKDRYVVMNAQLMEDWWKGM